MNLKSLELNRGVLDIRKIFVLLVAFQLTTLSVVMTYDKMSIILYLLALFIPLYLLFIPFQPILGFLAMFVATGLDFIAQIGKTQGAVVFVRFTYFHVALVVTIVAVLMNMVMKRSLRFPSLTLWPPLLMFLVMVCVSLIYTPEFPTGVWTCVRYIMLAVLTWMTIKVVDKEWKVSFLLWVFVLVPTAISMLSMYQIMTQGDVYSEMVYRAASALGLVVYRATGTFQNPNRLANFLMIGAIVSFGLLFDKRHKLAKPLLLICFFVIAGGLVSTFSRGGWLATISGMTMILLLQKKWSYFAAIFTVFILAVIYLIIRHPDLILAVLYRFSSIFNPSSDSSSSSRLSLIQSGIWMWQDHPIFGVGIEGFAPMMKYYFDPNMPVQTLHVIEPHTVQIEMLAELGLVGFTIFCWFFFTVLFHGIRTSQTIQNTFLRNTQIILTSFFIALFVGYTFSTDMHDNNLWITVGLIYAIPLVERYAPSRGTDNAREDCFLPEPAT